MPPAGSASAGAAAADAVAAHIKLTAASRQRAQRVAKRGLALRIASDEAAGVTLRVRLARRDARRLGLRSAVVARATASFDAAGSRSLRLRLTAAGRRALQRIGMRDLRVVVRAAAADRAGNRSSASIAVAVSR